MTEQLPVLIRDWRPDDRSEFSFVMDSWIKAFSQAGFNRFIPWEIYSANQKATIFSLLEEEARILIVCASDDPAQVFGYLCWTPGDPPTIHWIFIKEIYRRNGLATMLLTEAGIDPTQPLVVSHMSYICQQMDKQKKASFIFVPPTPTKEVN